MVKLEIITNDNLKAVLRAAEDAKERALIKIGAACVGHAKTNTPVRTGNLRSSMVSIRDKDNDCDYIGTDVDYGKYVELGTSRMAGRHMLQKAGTEYREEYKNIVETEYKNP